jgi:glycosyltransferase involved in cell wall biosynthesis
MSSPPTFSVCISTMDRPVELRRCLESIVSSTALPIEIVVSDDGRDPTLTKRVCDRFPLARYVRGPCVGQGANRDSASRAALGDYFSFIDDDAIMSPTFLKQMQETAATSCGREIFTGDVLEAGKRITPSNITFLGHFGRKVRDRLETVNFNANAFPRSTLSVASFDRHLRYGYEDSDFCTQALSAGYRIVHRPEICNEHRPSPINRSASYTFREESRFYTSLKRYALIQRRPPEALAYLLIAPVHQALHHVKAGRVDAIGCIARDMETALGYLRRQRRIRHFQPATIPTKSASISVIVPTFQRPVELAKCLTALARQVRKADQIIVALRRGDAESAAVIDRFRALKVVVESPGVVVSLNAGIDASSGEIIAITDDDAEPRTDWLWRIERRFQRRPCVGGVGGRDVSPESSARKRRVGKVQWFGRLIGNHDKGVGRAREVDVLKGVNMSFRRAALGARRFDERMRGGGAEVDHELQLCLALQRDGWRLLYDPAILVDHFQAQRRAGGDRSPDCPASVRAATHNNTVATLEHLPQLRRFVFLAWALCVGTRRDFGIVQFVRFAPNGFRAAWARLRGSIQGRIDGYQTWRMSAN